MRDLFQEIVESIRRNKLRTCLTGFAVAWGIFMLILLLGAGNGLINSTESNISGILSNTMDIRGGVTSKPYDGLSQGRRIKLTDQDIALTGSELFDEYIDDISAMVSKGGLTMAYGTRHFDISMTGVFPGYATMNKIDMLAGRFINENDIAQNRKVVVLTHLHAKNFLGGRTDYKRLIGKRIKVGDLSYQIIGVRHGRENENDTEIFTPFTTLKNIYGMSDEISTLSFTFHGLETEEENEEFEKQYKAIVNRSHRAAPDDESALWIMNRFTINMQMDKAMGIITNALWVIGIFTLLSGIVGVSNIMLITVKERTHEFGIRKAIGAKPWSIMKLILTESVTITAVSGYIGMLMGMIACKILDKTVGSDSMSIFGENIQMLVNPTVGLDVALEATLLLVIAGTVAGLFPARKAARVRPIEALRAD